MAIEDRDLTAGTKLWANHKAETYTAEVVAHADEKGNEIIVYKLSDGREFKSPSAAGTAITGKACNGWAFWTVGEPGEQTGPQRATRAPRGTVNAAPKPERKRRERKPVAPSETPTDGNGHALPIIQQTDGQYECGECGATFPTTEEAAAHLAEVHPA